MIKNIFTIPTLFIILFAQSCASKKKESERAASKDLPAPTVVPNEKVLVKNDTATYHEAMKRLANGDSSGYWPTPTIYPSANAILPYRRIIAYYGNFYSTRMGILGQYPPPEMLEKLKTTVKEWEAADSLTPVVPALHYIAVTAQRAPGKGNKYRLRMPFKEIDKAIEYAKEINAIVFLDIQVGWSTLEEEIPELKKYLQLPNVHLGIDPEFSMKSGKLPGTAIGSFDAADVNYASQYLAQLVKEFNIPQKILVIHRFTNPMLTNYQQIKTRPEVALVIHMDGFGSPQKKINTYKLSVHKQPVQYTGFKLFYRNDAVEGKRLMTPPELLALKPRPSYIQYQ